MWCCGQQSPVASYIWIRNWLCPPFLPKGIQAQNLSPHFPTTPAPEESAGPAASLSCSCRPVCPLRGHSLTPICCQEQADRSVQGVLQRWHRTPT